MKQKSRNSKSAHAKHAAKIAKAYRTMDFHHAWDAAIEDDLQFDCGQQRCTSTDLMDVKWKREDLRTPIGMARLQQLQDEFNRTGIRSELLAREHCVLITADGEHVAGYNGIDLRPFDLQQLLRCPEERHSRLPEQLFFQAAKQALINGYIRMPSCLEQPSNAPVAAHDRDKLPQLPHGMSKVQRSVEVEAIGDHRTLRAFVEGKGRKGAQANKAIEMLRKRMKGISPVIQGQKAAKGRPLTRSQYLISDLEAAWGTESPEN